MRATAASIPVRRRGDFFLRHPGGLTDQFVLQLSLIQITKKRVLVLPREIVHLADFAFGDVFRVHPANPHPPGVDMEHDLSRLIFIHAEEYLEDLHDEFHRRKVII